MLVALTMGAPLFGVDNTSAYAELKAKMATYIEQVMEENQVAGLSIALVDEDEVVWEKGFGYADITRQIPANEKTIYAMGSLSKVFTGIAIMQLVEQGRVELDRPLTDYIPEFEIERRFCRNRTFTIRDMLSHHSGLPGDMLYPGKEIVSEASTMRYLNYEKRVLDYLDSVHIPYRPRYVHAYSNIAYDLLAIVVERVTGLSFADYTALNIFTPLQMDASFTHLFLRDNLGSRLALPHNGRMPMEKQFFPGVGAAALSSDISGMAAFIRMLLANGSYRGRQLLSAASLSQMLTVQNGDVQLDRELEMGLSFFLNEHPLDYAGGSYGHTGNVPGYHSTFKILPAHGLGVIVTINSDQGGPIIQDIALKSIMQALEVKKGITPPQIGEPQEVVLSQRQAKFYEGLYPTNVFGPMKITAIDNRLVISCMGITMGLKVLDNGWLQPVSQIPQFQNVFLKVATVKGKRRIYGRDINMKILIGEEYRPRELASSWQLRAGTYQIVEDDPSLESKKSEIFWLVAKDGVLALATSKRGQMLLIPLNENECLVAGVGRHARETVYFGEEDGKSTIEWSGYTLEKVN